MGAVAAEGKALVVGGAARAGGAGSVAALVEADVTNNPTVAATMDAANPEAEAAASAEGAGSAVAATGEAADPEAEVVSATSSRRHRSGT